LGSLRKSLHLGLNCRGPVGVLLLGLIQRGLGLVDGLLPAFTVLLPGGLFARPFTLAAPPFPFVVESGLSFLNLVYGARGRFSSLGLSICRRLFVGPPPPRSVGSSACSSICPCQSGAASN
jgi:hypothetical protein